MTMTSVESFFVVDSRNGNVTGPYGSQSDAEKFAKQVNEYLSDSLLPIFAGMKKTVIGPFFARPESNLASFKKASK